jgi:hypothetical protein
VPTPNRGTHVYGGYVVGVGDWLGSFETPMDALGALGGLFTGQAALQAVDHPLVLVLSAAAGKAGNVQIGGANQTAVVPNSSGRPRRVDEVPSFSQAINLNADPALVRYDIVYAQATEPDTNNQACNVETPGAPQTLYTLTSLGGGNYSATPVSAAVGALTAGTVNQYAQALGWGYTQGTAGSGVPAPPAGFTTIIVIAVQPNNVLLVNANLTIQPPTFPTALLTKLQSSLPFIIVTGADPSGTTDSSVAIQAAIALAISLGIKHILLPGGTFLISTPLSILAASAGLILEGAGSSTTILLQGTSTNDVIDCTGVNNIQLRHLTIKGAASPTAGYGVNATVATHMVWEDVIITGCFNGALIAGGIDHTIDRVRIQSSVGDGLDLINYGGQIKMVECDFSLNGGHGTKITTPAAAIALLASSTRWANNNQNSVGGVGLYLDSTVSGLEFANCQWGSQIGSLDQQLYGIYFNGSNDFIVVSGGSIGGHPIAPVIFANPIQQHVFFKGVSGYNAVGQKTIPAFPVTGVAANNPWGADAFCTMSPAGATMTSLNMVGADDVSRSVPGTLSVPFQFLWPAGAQIIVVYSTATPSLTAQIA